jgi:TolA-binding protein
VREGRFVALAGLALAGCWVPIERGRQMEARIERLEVQSADQERTLAEQKEVIRERVARADQKIQEVQAKLDELNQAARRSGADLGVQLGRLQDEFSRVKGDLEVSLHKLAQLEKGVAAVDAKTDERFAALKGAGALDDLEARQRLAALPKGDEKNALYALAQKEDKDGARGVARHLYEEYARRWPSDPRTAEARFRAAEIHFDQRRWREALLGYGKVAEDFPRSDLAPEAMLGAAEAMIRLDMKEDARATLAQLVQKHPKHKAAARAKERLAQLAPPRAEKKKPAPANGSSKKR